MYTFSGVDVAQSLTFCVMDGKFLVGFVGLISLVFCVMVGRLVVGLRVAQSLDFCVMVGILLVGFVWLNLLFSM